MASAQKWPKCPGDGINDLGVFRGEQEWQWMNLMWHSKVSEKCTQQDTSYYSTESIQFWPWEMGRGLYTRDQTSSPGPPSRMWIPHCHPVLNLVVGEGCPLYSSLPSMCYVWYLVCVEEVIRLIKCWRRGEPGWGGPCGPTSNKDTLVTRMPCNAPSKGMWPLRHLPACTLRS